MKSQIFLSFILIVVLHSVMPFQVDFIIIIDENKIDSLVKSEKIKNIFTFIETVSQVSLRIVWELESCKQWLRYERSYL